jgi:surfeit locus 1 family protein
MVLFKLFSRSWILATLLVIAAAIVMVRLGIWQLDRLEGRRAFNQQVLSMRAMAPLAIDPATDPAGLEAMIYRMATASGEFDYANQVILGNQVYQNQIGVHLLTPLKIEGAAEMLLVDRGWVPFEDFQQGSLGAYNLSGRVTVGGMLRASQERLGLQECLAESPAGEGTLQVWCVDLAAIEAQTGAALMPVYLHQNPDPAAGGLPAREAVQIEITEGPHLGYAIQWFSFAGLLLIGYPIFVQRELAARERHARQKAEEATSQAAADPAPQNGGEG